MSKYKVGDRVRLINAGGDSTSRARVGDVGTVESLGTHDKNLLRVRMDDGHLTSRKDYRFELAQYKPVKGDRVRVVLEGEVEKRGDRESTGFSLQDETFYTGIDVEAPFVVSIEKIEPPVEVFKPGDVVRSGGFTYTVGEKGYISHQTGDYYPWGGGVGKGHFTSAGFERVPLS